MQYPNVRKITQWHKIYQDQDEQLIVLLYRTSSPLKKKVDTTHLNDKKEFDDRSAVVKEYWANSKWVDVWVSNIQIHSHDSEK